MGGIYVDAVDVHDPVEMRAVGAAGVARVAEDGTFFDLSAGLDGKLGHVHVGGFQTLAMVHTDSVSEDVEFLGEADFARGDGANGFAFRSALVDAAMKFSSGLAVVQTLDPKGRGHAAGDGRDQRFPPKAIVGDGVTKRGEEMNVVRRGVQRFDGRGERNVLRREISFEDDCFGGEERFLVRGQEFDPIVARLLRDGNRHQTESRAVGLRKHLDSAIDHGGRSDTGGAAHVDGLAELDGSGREAALLRKSGTRKRRE